MARYLDEQGLATLWDRIRQYVYECCCKNSGGDVSGETMTVKVPINSFVNILETVTAPDTSTTIQANSSATIAFSRLAPPSSGASVCLKDFRLLDNSLTVTLKDFRFLWDGNGYVPYVTLYNYGDTDVTISSGNVGLTAIVFYYDRQETDYYCVLAGSDCEELPDPM